MVFVRQSHRNAFAQEHLSSAKCTVWSPYCYNWASEINISMTDDSLLCPEWLGSDQKVPQLRIELYNGGNLHNGIEGNLEHSSASVYSLKIQLVSIWNLVG